MSNLICYWLTYLLANNNQLIVKSNKQSKARYCVGLTNLVELKNNFIMEQTWGLVSWRVRKEQVLSFKLDADV